MMRQIFQRLASEIRGLHQAAYVLAGFALLSALLAFLRDRILAHTFGAGAELDIYYAAFRIPDLIFVTVASLVSAYVLIPELARRDRDEQHRYVESITAGFFLIVAVVAGGVYLIAPAILSALYPDLVTGEYGETLVLITRVLLLQPVFLGLSNVFAAITQAHYRYMLYAVTPVLYNLGIIAGVVFLYPSFGLSGIVWGVVIGAVAHAAVQLPGVLTDGFMHRLPRMHDIRTVVHTMRLSLPRSLALSMNQLILVGLVAVAGTLTAGSITVFTFAFNLQSVPLSIIGASYSVAAFPTLAYMFSRGEHQRFVEQVCAAARHILFWSIPATVLVIVLRAYLVRVILGSGAFDWTDTRLTAAALALFVISLAAHALMLLLVRGYYAAGLSRVPVIVTGSIAVGSIALAYAFLALVERVPDVLLFIESLLRVEGLPGTQVLLLPLSYSIASLIGLVLIVVNFERRFGGFIAGISRVAGEASAAAGIGGAVAYGILALLGGISEATTFTTVLMYGFVAGSLGLAASIGVFWLLGSRELAETTRAVRRRVWRVSPVISGEEEL